MITDRLAVDASGFAASEQTLMLQISLTRVVSYEYNLRPRDMKNQISTVKENTVLYSLFYKHAQLYRPYRNS